MLGDEEQEHQRQHGEGGGRHDLRPLDAVSAALDEVQAQTLGDEVVLGTGGVQGGPHVVVVGRYKAHQTDPVLAGGFFTVAPPGKPQPWSHMQVSTKQGEENSFKEGKKKSGGL